MIIGVPKEIKNNEYRVGLLPASVNTLTERGHRVLVEHNAAVALGFTNKDYLNAGAEIADTAQSVFSQAQMIIKVKEPQANERLLLRPQQILFTFLHLAPDRLQTDALIKQKVTAIAYETVTDIHNNRPLLTPMSEVAGRMSVQLGAQALEVINGGSGTLLSGVPGISPANVVIIGGGTVGKNAAKIAIGLGSNVTIIDKNLQTLRALDELYHNKITTCYSSQETIYQQLLSADLVIGAVLIPGATAPKLVSNAMIKMMKKGSAIVDVAIDQGGCFESSQVTTHQAPTFIQDGVVHYCVANIPGIVPKTSTLALNNATLPFILEIADKGIKHALLTNKHLLNGLNLINGKVTCLSVAKALGLEFTEPLSEIHLLKE